MPAVKKKTAKKKPPPVLARLFALFERYTIAGAAGSAILLGLIALGLWAGGYFAMIGRAADRTAATVAIAAAGHQHAPLGQAHG